jgi:hypothetical protein
MVMPRPLPDPKTIPAVKTRARYYDLEGDEVQVEVRGHADGHDYGGAYWFGREHAAIQARRALQRGWVPAIISRIQLREDGEVVEIEQEGDA